MFIVSIQSAGASVRPSVHLIVSNFASTTTVAALLYSPPSHDDGSIRIRSRLGSIVVDLATRLLATQRFLPATRTDQESQDDQHENLNHDDSQSNAQFQTTASEQVIALSSLSFARRAPSSPSSQSLANVENTPVKLIPIQRSTYEFDSSSMTSSSQDTIDENHVVEETPVKDDEQAYEILPSEAMSREIQRLSLRLRSSTSRESHARSSISTHRALQCTMARLSNLKQRNPPLFISPKSSIASLDATTSYDVLYARRRNPRRRSTTNVRALSLSCPSLSPRCNHTRVGERRT